jgi:3',5'-cyclic-AMP phosphodiesterase
VDRPFLVVQLSDPHIGAEWGGDLDPVARLAETVAAVCVLERSPDAVLISGDLADNATDTEYEQVRELVAPIDAPLYVLPGNHDDRAALRRHFDLPGKEGDPVQYAVRLGPLRLVALDSTRPGDDAGELRGERLAWFEAALAAEPTIPTVVALHHAPFMTGIPDFDDVALAAGDQQALGEVVGGHPHVQAILAGHLHLAVVSELGGRSVRVAPSTYVQFELDFDPQEIRVSAEPPGFVVHAWLDGELVSYVRAVS